MAVVYFYIPVENAEDVVDCGLKLSEWRMRQQATLWNPVERPCFSTLLHPHDDLRYKNQGFRCIKLNIPAEYCIIADEDLYKLSVEYPEIKKEYMKTMVPLNQYIFGSFRRPECLVFSTVLPEQISCLGKGMDEPILYEDSETLYVNNFLQNYKDRYDEANRVLLYSFLTLRAQHGAMKVFKSREKRLAVFFDNNTNRHITVPIPDFKQYQMS